MSSNAIDYVGIGFCSNDYLSVLPHIPYDSKVQMVEHLVQGGGPAATATVAAAVSASPPRSSARSATTTRESAS